MLTSRELSLLRTALAYWSEENLAHALPTDEPSEVSRIELLDTKPSDINELYGRLDEARVRYVLVNTANVQIIHERLFVYPPSLSPTDDRWRILSAID
jgi:hypothetical protein